MWLVRKTLHQLTHEEKAAENVPYENLRRNTFLSICAIQRVCIVKAISNVSGSFWNQEIVQISSFLFYFSVTVNMEEKIKTSKHALSIWSGAFRGTMELRQCQKLPGTDGSLEPWKSHWATPRTQRKLETMNMQWHQSPGWGVPPPLPPGFGATKVNTWTDLVVMLPHGDSSMSKGVRKLREWARDCSKWWMMGLELANKKGRWERVVWGAGGTGWEKMKP